MAKITKLEEKTFQGKHTGWKVSIDNAPLENMDEKNSDKNLREGDEVTFTVEDYVSKKGNHSNLLTVKRASGTSSAPQQTPSITPQRPAIHVGSGKSKEELKVEAAVEIMKVVLSAFYEGKIETGKVAPDQREYVTLVWSEIDEVFDKK